MTDTWGDGYWGDGEWGITFTPYLNTLTELLDAWPHDSLSPQQRDAVHDIFVATANSLNHIESDIDELREQRLIQSASELELEKIANEVGVTRNAGEGDDHLRFRTLIAKAASRSQGTFSDLANVMAILFDEQTDNIAFAPIDGKPTVNVQIPQNLIDNCPLTRSELQAELNQTLPVSDDITIVNNDVWVLGASGKQGLGRGELV